MATAIDTALRLERENSEAHVDPQQKDASSC